MPWYRWTDPAREGLETEIVMTSEVVRKLVTLPEKSAYDPAGPGIRFRIWAGYSGSLGATMTYTAGTNQKAYDGQCLKCHRDAGAVNGIGITK